MLAIDFDDNDQLMADLKAKQMINDGLYSRFQLSPKECLEKASIGMLGEIAFQKLLKEKDIKFSIDNSDFSIVNSDQFDVKINNSLFDIKVAKTQKIPKDEWTYGYPEEQHPETKDYIIIGCLNTIKKCVIFYGWIKGEDVKEFPVVTSNTFAGFLYKTPNHEFTYGDLNKNFDELFNLL